MIIQLALNSVMTVMFFLTGWIDIPLLPASVVTYFTEFVEYLAVGASILSNYVHLEYVLSLFAIVVVVDGAVMGYKFVMWVLKKIPILNIK